MWCGLNVASPSPVGHVQIIFECGTGDGEIFANFRLISLLLIQIRLIFPQNYQQDPVDGFGLEEIGWFFPINDYWNFKKK